MQEQAYDTKALENAIAGYNMLNKRNPGKPNIGPHSVCADIQRVYIENGNKSQQKGKNLNLAQKLKKKFKRITTMR